jgi:hypothetical protein
MSRRPVLFASLTAAALLVAGCSRGGGKQARPTNLTTSTTDATTAAPYNRPSADRSVPPSCAPSTSTAAQVTRCSTEHARVVKQDEQIFPVHGTILSVNQILALLDHNTTSPHGPSVVAAYAFLTTFGGAGRAFEADNPAVDPNAPAYVVTQHWSSGIGGWMGPVAPPPGWKSPTVSSVVVSAVTGKGMDSCTGCDVVQPDGTLRSALGTKSSG